MEKYMRRAIELAEKGLGFTNPNPLVGAVIVKNGKIIGEGYHERCGGLHAERNALRCCTENPRGADMYVTLEPCCHYGKTPPCTAAIIESGIRRVFVGSHDPNPLVSGGGIQELRKNGIEVTENVLREECDALNAIFFHYIRTKTPYVIMKSAISADGKIATVSGSSKWITSEAARADAQLLRKRAAAILTGIETVIRDDPMLSCRTENPSNPLRVICDSKLRIDKKSKIMQTADEIPTCIATACNDTEKTEELENMGARVIIAADGKGRVDLKKLMHILGKDGIDSVLSEGGGTINASLIRNSLVNRLYLYIAPKLIGGDGKSALSLIGVQDISEAVRLKNPSVTHIGDNVLIKYDVEGWKCLQE